LEILRPLIDPALSTLNNSLEKTLEPRGKSISLSQTPFGGDASIWATIQQNGGGKRYAQSDPIYPDRAETKFTKNQPKGMVYTP
jgi:hypothetical protein